MKRIAILFATLLAGCQTPYLDPNYAAQIQAYQDRERMWSQVALEKARTEQARYLAIQHIAHQADPQSKQAALLVLALSGNGAANIDMPRVMPVPVIPETQEDKALKWASIFAGPIMSVAQGYFGYKLGVTQSNNAANAAIASYNSLSSVGIAGFDSISTVAQSGFRTNAEIAGFGINFGQRAVDNLQRPNIIVTDGVIGSGSYVGPNSGTNSGNSGRIGSPDCPNSAGNGVGGVLTPGGVVVPGIGGAASINCGTTSGTGRP